VEGTHKVHTHTITAAPSEMVVPFTARCSISLSTRFGVGLTILQYTFSVTSIVRAAMGTRSTKNQKFPLQKRKATQRTQPQSQSQSQSQLQEEAWIHRPTMRCSHDRRMVDWHCNASEGVERT
jgi:hypothetical protein